MEILAFEKISIMFLLGSLQPKIYQKITTPVITEDMIIPTGYLLVDILPVLYYHDKAKYGHRKDIILLI